jgi:DNA polymerase III alpha subunit (gram-positive type)
MLNNKINKPIKLKPILYLSFDVETDGNNPMLNSMISIGFCGMTDGFTCTFEYQANFEPLEWHEQEPQCMEFWSQNKLAWNVTQINKKHYSVIMEDLSNHFTELNKIYNLKFIAMPACFDWMFFKSYYEMAQAYLKKKFYNIGFNCICISSYFISYCESKNMRSNDKEVLKLQLMEYDKNTDHFAIEDARCQAKLFIKIKQMITENIFDY